MKIKTLLLPVLVIALFVTSCKDKKAETTEPTATEIAAAAYQCPMNCEDGKTYAEPGKCPVCKMDLMQKDQESKSTCGAYNGTECKCEPGTCTCKDCPKKSKEMTCKMHKDGEKCDQANCKEHSDSMHMNGEHKCEGDKCTSANCAEHGKKMTCATHKDGKCKCEGDKCSCENCAEHNK